MRAGATPDPWWPAGAPTAGAPVRLLCLPHAGGGASIYRSWRAAVAPIEVCPLQPPGREARIREAPFRRMDDLVAELIEVLRSGPLSPYAIFGYSLGALVAYELARGLEAAGLPRPSALFVAAAPPPHRRRDRALHRLPDEAFRAALRELDGTPEGVLEHPELMELLLPTLRADFELFETYRSSAGAGRAPAKLRVPVTAFGGTEDPSVPLEDLRAWGDVAAGPFRVVTFPAGHFFLASHGAELLEQVRAALAEAAPWR